MGVSPRVLSWGRRPFGGVPEYGRSRSLIWQVLRRRLDELALGAPGVAGNLTWNVLVEVKPGPHSFQAVEQFEYVSDFDAVADDGRGGGGASAVEAAEAADPQAEMLLLHIFDRKCDTYERAARGAPLFSREPPPELA